MKRNIIILVVVGPVGAAAWFAYTRFAAAQTSQEEVISYEFAPLERGELVSDRERAGQSALQPVR